MLHDYLNFVSDVDLKMTYTVQKMALRVFKNIIMIILYILLC